MEYVGYVDPEGTTRWCSVVMSSRRELIAFWLKDGRVIAGMSVNVWDVVEHIKALVTSGVAIDAGRLADDSTDLSVLPRPCCRKQSFLCHPQG